jgi:uncharacterized Zn finger protein (UPF0148 family)
MEKQKRKMGTVICASCGTSFEKAVSEIKRSEKRTGKHYCSQSCVGVGNIDHIKNWTGSTETAQLISNNRKDEFTGFREFINRAKRRSKLGDLTLNDLKEQWEKQKGICPYTGILLKLPQARKRQLMFEMASLDRIDSSKLYEKNNVVFVSTPINFMKNSMSEEETVAYCKKIALFWSNK